MIMVSGVFKSLTTFFDFHPSFQPTLAAIDFIRNFKRLKQFLPKTLVIRSITLTTFTLLILFLRLSIQNFESPTFRKEDNPVSFADDPTTRILSQNYLYALSFFLFVSPQWLSFDWSFDSIELIVSFLDLRVISIVIFHLFLVTTIFLGLRRK